MDFIQSIFSKTVVGLDIGVSGIKAVQLSLGKTVSLLAYNRIALPWDSITSDGVIKNDEALITALKKLFSGKTFSSQKVSIGVFGNSILSKPIHMPQMDRKAIQEQIYWEAEQYIPFNIEECSLDFAIVGNTVQQVESGAQSSVEILLVAAKKDYIEAVSGVIERAGLSPVVIDYQAFALGNCFEFNYGVETSQLGVGETDVIIDFGAGSTKLSFVEKENTVFTTKIAPCGSGCTQAISERIGEGFEQAEAIKLSEPDSPLVTPIIRDYNAHWVTELQKNIDVFFSQSGERTLRKIFYCGGASRTLGLIESLQDRYPEQTELLNPLKNVVAPKSKNNFRLIDDLTCLGSVAVGLALRKPGDSR
jgi:type IV pilus assembly protein PilM